MHRPTSLIRLWLAAASLAVPVGAVAAPPASPPASQRVAGPDASAAQTAVKGLVGAIRYGKDAAAQKRLGVETMAKSLLGATYERMDAQDRGHFVRGLGELLVADSFPRGREMFHYLDALLFGAPARVGDQLHLPCTIVVHRELKKVEIPVTWVLGREDSAWKVVDIVAQNESTLAGIREEEVGPLMKDGGVPKLLQTLDARLARVKKAGAAGDAAAKNTEGLAPAGVAAGPAPQLLPAGNANTTPPAGTP